MGNRDRARGVGGRQLAIKVILSIEVVQQNAHRRFTDLRRRLGLPDACDFHAFRTTFITTVEGLPTTNTTLVDSTVGHKPRREMAAHYAKLGPQHTRALVDSVEFGIDLSHLYASRQKRTRPFQIHPSRRAEQAGAAAP